MTTTNKLPTPALHDHIHMGTPVRAIHYMKTETKERHYPAGKVIGIARMQTDCHTYIVLLDRVLQVGDEYHEAVAIPGHQLEAYDEGNESYWK